MGWEIIVDLSIIGILIIIATALRARYKFIQKLLIPNALLAGFIGLIIRILRQPQIQNADSIPDAQGQ